MTSVWVESLGRTLENALDLLAEAVRGCSEPLWKAPMWPVHALAPGHQFLTSDWRPIEDPRQREALALRWVERFSTPWSVAWHTLETLDYDLAGEFAPWMPPPPFRGHPHWRDLPSLPTAWTPHEIVGYLDYCRGQVRATITGMTDETAARPLPEAHRYGGRPHAAILLGLVGHTTEHGAQIRQFVTSAAEMPTG